MSTMMKGFLQFVFVLSLLYIDRVEDTCVNVNQTDVVFVVDSSGSICMSDPSYTYLKGKTCSNWISVLNFTTGIVNQLQIGPTAVMVGLVVFHKKAGVAWTLDRYPIKAELIRAINNLHFTGGGTATTLGLRAMRTQVFGASGDRPNATNVAIVITDGNPNLFVNELAEESRMAQSQGITMVAIGITKKINESILKSFSSPPHKLNINYFMSPDFKSISSISQRLEVHTFCPSEAPKLDPPTVTTAIAPFPQTTHQSFTPRTPCKSTSAVADITFVVDTSGSICDSDPRFIYGRDKSCNNFEKLKTFLKDIVSSLTVGSKANRVALVIFNTTAYVAWPLDRYFDRNSLVNAIEQLRYYPGGDTATTDGLLKMRTEVFGRPGDRPGISNVAVIITDGRPTIREFDLQDEITRCQAAGINMVAIGVTRSIDENTLRKLSSPPQQRDVNYFITANYNNINTIKRGLEVQVLCPPLTTPGPIVKPATPPPCTTTSTVADLTFVVDTSGSICETDPRYIYGRDKSCNNFEKLKTFLKDIVTSLSVGSNANRVALVIFNTTAYVAWPLDRYFDRNSLVNAFDQLRYYPGGDTATTDGLLKMRTEVFGRSGDRPGISNVAVIITDGKPTIREFDLQDEITRCQAAGINMVAIGVTRSIDENTLRKLSSPPQQRDVNYFITANYNSINTIKRGLEVQVLCPPLTTPGPIVKPATPPPCTTTSTVADLTFVVDTSGSICETDPRYIYGRDKSCNNFEKLKTFLQDIVTSLSVGSNANRVALVIFNTTAYVAWPLDRYFDRNSLVNAIDQLRYYPGGDTATTDGLLKMRTEVFGRPGDRPGISNVAVIITDGRPTIREFDLQDEITRCQAAGINMVAIGVTRSIDENTLRKLSSPPQQRDVNYFMTANYNSINNIKKGLEVQVLCPRLKNIAVQTSV